MKPLTTGAFANIAGITVARNGRISSWDQNGKNHDYWQIPPNETISLGELTGPGAIKHIWMTSFCRRSRFPSIMDPQDNAMTAPVNEIAPPLGVVWDAYDPDYYRKVLIRITWDHQDCPSVLVPYGDFFCIGHCLPMTFQSLPVQVSVKPEESKVFGGAASVSCYWPMPFNKHAKVEIVNENDVPFGLFFHIDYELYPEALDDNVPYFHALWKRELPCNGWGNDLQVNSPEVNSVANLDGAENYVVLDVEGRGHYVGCNLSVKHFQGSWWGEGDDMVFIDGEPMPSIVGTGTEDYFNHAWGMQSGNYSLYSGSILHETDTPETYQVSYRFHIEDPIHFSKSLKVTMEHGHANHLSDDWSSTAYWYQLLPTKPFSIQPVEERIPLKFGETVAQKSNPSMKDDMKAAQLSMKHRAEMYFPKQKTVQEKYQHVARDYAEHNILDAEQLRKLADQMKKEV